MMLNNKTIFISCALSGIRVVRAKFTAEPGKSIGGSKCATLNQGEKPC